MTLSDDALSRIIEMAWEDRTPFEAIEHQFGLNENGVIKPDASPPQTSQFQALATTCIWTQHQTLKTALTRREQRLLPNAVQTTLSLSAKPLNSSVLCLDHKVRRTVSHELRIEAR